MRAVRKLPGGSGRDATAGGGQRSAPEPHHSNLNSYEQNCAKSNGDVPERAIHLTASAEALRLSFERLVIAEALLVFVTGGGSEMP